MQIARIGLDLAKYVFEKFTASTLMERRCCARRFAVHAVPAFFANLPPCLVGMEASNGAHFWAKALSELGHDVRLISPQFVAPYVKSNKNDRNDAEAICEAVSRLFLRFVPVKSAEQLAVQAAHRIRGAPWLPIASGSSIKSAVFSGSMASSLRRTSAIFGELWRGSLATMRTAL